MRHSRLLGLAALLAAMVAPGCGGGNDNNTDSGPTDLGGDATINPNGLPAGSPCTINSECGGANALCLADGLFPLSALGDSTDPVAQSFAALGLPLPGGYCSTVPTCATDADCGPGGSCFFPLEQVDPALLEEGVGVLGLMNQADIDIFLSFGTYGQCLQACESNTDCTRQGYVCTAPLSDFIGLVGGDVESTFCVGTNESVCTDFCVNGTCTEDAQDMDIWTCNCEPGYTGENCETVVPGLCPVLAPTAPLQVSATGYDEGDIGTYSCATGYDLVGTATRTCQSDATWTGTEPTCVVDPCSATPCMNGGTCDDSSGSATCSGCNAGWSGTLCDVPVDCGALTATAPLMVSTTATTLDGVATYTCSGGLIVTGSATRACQSDGDWSGSAPTCEAPPPTCTPNPCDNGGVCLADGSGNFASCDCATGWTGTTCGVPVTCGVLSPASPLAVLYSDAQNTGSTATYSCDAGFTLQGAATRSCADDGFGVGTWTGSAPTCQPITCPTLTITAPLQADTASTSFGTTVNYSCAAGYQLASGGATSATCGAAGWSPAALPTCVLVTCPALGAPSNGSVDDGANEYDTIADYSCDTGYEVTGGTEVRCGAAGAWVGTPPTCAPVACPTRNAPTNGTITPSSGPYVFGDSITYACNMGYSLGGGTAMQDCLASGNWSSTAPTCTQNLCPTLTAPANGSVDAMMRTPGTVAGYSCDSGYQLSSVAPVTCQNNGTWQGTPPTCQLRDCGAPPAANANGTVTPPGTTTVGAMAAYACNIGYTGGGSLSCLPTGSWSAAAAPACTIVSCGAPPTVTNGMVGGGSNTYNSSRTYTCDNGYQIGMGSGNVTCLATGMWSTAPTCEPIPNGCATNPCQNGGTCTESGGMFTGCTGCNAGYSGSLCEIAVDCGSLSVTNGSVGYTPMNTTLGTVATTTCNMGYNRTGPASRTCQTNGTWSGAANTCVPVDCGAAPDGTNSSATETSTSLGGTATYTCTAGYVVSGGNASRTCQASGTWSGAALSCTLGDCGAPLAAGSNAVVATPGGTNTGDTATYSCNVGYTAGAGVTSRTCAVASGTASWTPAGASLSCNIVSCGAPPAGTNSSVAFTTTNYNDTAMYTCTNGYTGGPSTITCQANGTWSGGGLSCTPVSCGAAPAANANGTVSGSGTTFGATRTYACNAGYSGGGSLNCQANATWSGTTPACTLVNPYCSPTAPMNGGVTGGTTIGSMATYTCNNGYTITSGNASRTCNAGGGTGTLSGTQPTCGPVSCGSLSNPANGTVNTSGGTSFGNTATYACNPGYAATGGSASRMCQADMNWSGSPLVCTMSAPTHCIIEYRAPAVPNNTNCVAGVSCQRVNKTGLGAFDVSRQVGAGRVVLRFQTNAMGQPLTGGTVEVLNFYNAFNFSSGPGSATVTTVGCTNTGAIAGSTCADPFTTDAATALVAAGRNTGTLNMAGNGITWNSCTYTGDQPGAGNWGISDANSGTGAGCVPWNNRLTNLNSISGNPPTGLPPCSGALCGFVPRIAVNSSWVQYFQSFTVGANYASISMPNPAFVPVDETSTLTRFTIEAQAQPAGAGSTTTCNFP
jgi:hypothetical protein